MHIRNYYPEREKMNQLQLWPESQEEQAERLEDCIFEIRGTVLEARQNKDLMDKHLESAITDLDKGILRLQKKHRGLVAYLDTRKRLKQAEKMLEGIYKFED